MPLGPVTPGTLTLTALGVTTTVGGGLVKLGASASAGATSATLSDSISGIAGDAGYVIIDPFTLEAELRKITSVTGGQIVGWSGGLTYSHSTNDLVMVVPGGVIPWTWWGAKSGSTAYASDNVTAFNRLTAAIYALGTNYFSGIYIPSGLWYIDGELKPERDQAVVGSNVMNSVIKAHTTFPFTSTGEVAMIHPYRDGSPVTYADAGPSSRWFLGNLKLDGSSLTDSNGILSSPQQPDAWANIRVDNCVGLYGICLADVQQHIMFNIEMLNNKNALRYRSCEFVYMQGFNAEGSTTRTFIAEDLPSSPAGGCHHNTFRDVHLEQASGQDAGEVLFDINSGDGWLFDQVWLSHLDIAATFLDFDVSAGLSGYPIYELRDIRMNQPSSTYKAVNDVQRSISRTTGNASDGVNRYIHHIVSGRGPKWMLEQTGKNTTGGTHDAPQKVDGLTVIRNSAPPDGDLSANEMAVWFDPTNGASKLMVKAKQADGTVKTGSINLT